MLKSLFLLPVLLTIGLNTTPAEARKKKKKEIQKISGVIQKCHDGDTCRLIVNKKILKIRFFGIDTPELSQRYGKQAQVFTESTLKGKTVDLECDGSSFDRLTCTVFLEGRNINREIVQKGWAYDSTKYSKGLYAADAAAAKTTKAGMWKDENLVSPYCFRHKTNKKCRVSQSYMP